MKRYIDYMDEITEDELLDGLLGNGLFCEKLPPIFTSEGFCNYCKKNPNVIKNSVPKRYVTFDSMRNINVPRTLGIPTPINYAILCFQLKENWEKIKNVFRKNTIADDYKVSRIHIRKRNNNKSIFEMSYGDVREEDNDCDLIPETTESERDEGTIFSMNYKNWKEDGDPLLDFSLGKKYVVKADIAQCFSSSYSHAISWALVGKNISKNNRKSNEWYNKIDKSCRNMKDGETQGFIIGPHASNVLSEILLTSIDKVLVRKGYHYIRYIDDYTCYTESYEQAEKFLVDLHTELRKFNFELNQKKTVIEKLPQASEAEWVQILKDKQIIGKYGQIDYNTAKSYLDTALNVMKKNEKNAASILFAIKVLGDVKNKISRNAREYCVKKMCSLAIVYPYLVPNMDKYVFDAFNASVFDIEAFSKVLYKDSLYKKNYEGVCYALFYAVKYNFQLPINVDDIINASDCISKILLWNYSRKFGLVSIEKALYGEAQRLATMELFDDNWIFVYEVLPITELQNGWKKLKRGGVSFLKEY